MTWYYKKVKKIVPWCKRCNSEIYGNGSIITPYHCECGEWKYDSGENDYVLIYNK